MGRKWGRDTYIICGPIFIYSCIFSRRWVWRIVSACNYYVLISALKVYVIKPLIATDYKYSCEISVSLQSRAVVVQPTAWQLAPSNTDFSMGRDKNTGNEGQNVSVTVLAAESILSVSCQIAY